jgi:hypothetical protein
MISHSFAALTREISCSTLEINLVFPRTHVLFSMHRRMGRGGGGGGGGGGGARAPPNFYGRAKINAKFGQNIQISEKFWCPENIFVSLRKLRDVGQNFRMFVEKYLVCPENFFRFVRKNFFGDLPPPPRANYTVPPQTRLGPYVHVSMYYIAYNLGINCTCSKSLNYRLT